MKSGYVYEGNKISSAEIEIGRLLEIARPLGVWTRKFGVGVIIFSALGFWWIYWPLLNAEIRYRSIDAKIQRHTEAPVNTENIPTVNKVADIQAVPKFIGYRIFIPKIGAESKVISNVDPFDKNAYSEALLQGVAEAKGLSHPGEVGTTFLFAHSVGNRIDFARYNAVFYLLDKLENQDTIYINYGGNRYEYVVENKEILRANDLKYLQPQTSEEKLVLQTCYPPGTSWKRLVVVAKPIR
jgi:LPXTG-site transpeptidase (sortase) family protein